MNRDYRFVVLDAAGAALREMTIVCADDAGALLVAGRIGGGGPVEVWDGPRLVTGIAVAEATDGGDENRPRAFNPFRRGVWRRSDDPA